MNFNNARTTASTAEISEHISQETIPEESMEEKILFVDDEENILAAFRRQLRKEFNLHTANSGPEALDILSTQGPFAVIVTDYRMPRMDGIQFLKQAQEICPHAVRIMLTGQADLNTAIEAVNNGNIFRFLTKPCPTEKLVTAVARGLVQYRLVQAEKDLLEKTLKTSINLMTELLSLANPLAFSRALRIRRVIREINAQMILSGGWECEMAGTFSQIGCISVSTEILRKVNDSLPLSLTEQRIYASHPSIGYRLLAKIHRLESVAKMVRDQNRPYNSYEKNNNNTLRGRKESLGAQTLHMAIDYDQLIMAGNKHAEAIRILTSRENEYNPDILNSLGNADVIFDNWSFRMVDTSLLEAGMILNEDVQSRTGEVIGLKHQEVTQTLLERILAVAEESGVLEPIPVIIQGNHNGKLNPAE
jgi:response regulator RpfG family c-di-GMP phosphodiesterase